MPQAVQDNSARPRDDLDDIFNLDTGLDAAINGINSGEIERASNTTDAISQPTNRTSGVLPLTNLNEEVVVTKKRAPIAKLDEERLLSAKGIPRLRKIGKSQKYQGKGHEFTDVARLLSMYQLWLDELYPRAKFMDGLAIIEKLGHKKKLQIFRRSWIDEGKPKPREASEEVEDTVNNEGNGNVSAANAGDSTDNQAIEGFGGATVASNSIPQNEPSMDELDALMADDTEELSQRRDIPTSNDFTDEEEALADMIW